MPADTIAAISTAQGHGAVAVVRLSGPDAVQIADRLFVGKEALARTRSHSIRHGRLCNLSGNVVDEVLAAVMKAPDTYTGEDVVEISCHGGLLMSQLVLQAFLEAGCRLAEPGEFTRRAFLNEKIDLSQAEAVADLVAAKTRTAAEHALRQLEGGLSERIRAITNLLIGALAEVEARIDFPDDVPEEIKAHALIRTLNDCAGLLEEIVNERAAFVLLSAGARIPIVGRPNVGKSSLFNAIVGRSRVIVSSLPGTTRDTIEEEIELEGVPITLIDTAGLRSGTEEIEGEGVLRTTEQIRLADIVLFVIDASSGDSHEKNLAPAQSSSEHHMRAPAQRAYEHQMGAQCAYQNDVEILRTIHHKPLVIVINKIDIASPSAARIAVESCISQEIDAGEIVEVSATLGTGLSSLRDLLKARLISGNFDFHDFACASQRHLSSLRSAHENIENARRLLESRGSEDLIAVELREAAQDLSTITGSRVGPEVLDSIFSRFCVGK